MHDLSCVLDSKRLLVARMLRRAGLADSPLVVLWDIVLLAIGSNAHNLRDNSLLDSLEVLTLLELHLVLLAELDVRSVQGGAESAVIWAGSSLVGSRSGVGAVLVRSLVVAGTDDLSDKICHVHLDMELEKIDERVELDVAVGSVSGNA